MERVLLVTIDTLRADHVGAYGGPARTPALDALAAEGVLVEQFCTPIPSTGPAHASLLTGLYPWRHGTLRNAVPLDPRIPTLADRMRAHGLATAAFVSSYILDSRFGFHQGFETYVFEPTEEFAWRGRRAERFWTRGAATARAAMHWITEHAGEPFFVWVHFFDPHMPYRPPPGYAVPPTQPVDTSGKQLPVDHTNVRDLTTLRQLIRAYRGEVAYADAQVGRLVARLRLLGLLDRTAVVVTADHGEGLGDHALLEHGRTLYDELVRVPLLIRAPGLPAGRRLAGQAQLEDLSPTLLALVGGPAPRPSDGLDLLPWLRGAVDRSPRAAVFGRRRPYAKLRDQAYVRIWPQKWIGARGRPGLRFDLGRDPRELAVAPGDGMPEALRRALELPAVSGEGGNRAVDPDPEVRRALEALGYVED